MKPSFARELGRMFLLVTLPASRFDPLPALWPPSNAHRFYGHIRTGSRGEIIKLRRPRTRYRGCKTCTYTPSVGPAEPPEITGATGRVYYFRQSSVSDPECQTVYPARGIRYRAEFCFQKGSPTPKTSRVRTTHHREDLHPNLPVLETDRPTWNDNGKCLSTPERLGPDADPRWLAYEEGVGLSPTPGVLCSTEAAVSPAMQVSTPPAILSGSR